MWDDHQYFADNGFEGEPLYFGKDPNDPFHDQKNDEWFRIGLVMAGAVSAGAYTAGVMDFIIEALIAWEKEKDNPTGGDPIPSHQVKFHALAGASAGGMCAGIFASSLRNYRKGTTSLTPDPDAESLFYQAWVSKVDINPMLEMDDIENEKGKITLKPASFLNVKGAKSLEALRDYGIGVSGGDANDWPAWLHDPLPIILTVTNLNGIPFSLGFSGGATATDHAMSKHSDQMLFSLSASGRMNHFATKLGFTEDGGVRNWPDFGEALLATGAFPVAFAPRKLKRSKDYYNNLCYPVTKMNGDGSWSVGWKNVKPNWPASLGNTDYALWTVDGGAINNEPFELARTAIADHTGRNDRSDKSATRMVLMVDPFPDGQPDTDALMDSTDFLGSLSKLFGAYPKHSRLKMDDLILFDDTKGSSRFAVAPSKDGKENPLACGSLNAFGGLLDKNWRHHDYLLGRLNAQKFLKDWFVVHKDHRLVAGKNPQPSARDANYVRIIPLVGGMEHVEAAVSGIDEFNPTLPDPKKWSQSDINIFSKKVIKRGKRVAKAQIFGAPRPEYLPPNYEPDEENSGIWAFFGSLFSSLKVRIGVNLIVSIAGGKAKKKLQKILKTNLNKYGLFTPPFDPDAEN